RRKRRKPRGAQLAVVETPEGPLHLVHWHLGLAERERHWQVNHLLEHPDYRGAAGLPRLVVGDFNDWRNTLARGPFARHGLAQVADSRHAPKGTGSTASRSPTRCGAKRRIIDVSHSQAWPIRACSKPAAARPSTAPRVQ